MIERLLRHSRYKINLHLAGVIAWFPGRRYSRWKIPCLSKAIVPWERTISLHIAEEVKIGTLEKELKVPVTHIPIARLTPELSEPYQHGAFFHSIPVWSSTSDCRQDCEPAWNWDSPGFAWQKPSCTLLQPKLEIRHSLWKAWRLWHLTGWTVNLNKHFNSSPPLTNCILYVMRTHPTPEWGRDAR